MKSDRLEARFQRLDKEIKSNVRRHAEGGRLELAEATGREVVVTRVLSDNELQVAKAGKVTYKAKDINDENSFDEVDLVVKVGNYGWKAVIASPHRPNATHLAHYPR